MKLKELTKQSKTKKEDKTLRYTEREERTQDGGMKIVEENRERSRQLDKNSSREKTGGQEESRRDKSRDCVAANCGT